MRKAVVAINEVGELFSGNFEDAQFYLIIDNDKKKKIQDCALDLSRLNGYTLLGKKASAEFKNIIESKGVGYLFLDFSDISDALEYFRDYSNKIDIFDTHVQAYEDWFNKNRYVYLSEIEAIKKTIPKKGKGIEIGVGSGRFAIPLGIKIGVEPSKKMGEIAQKHGINVINAVAESLPIADNSYDFALMAVTICFVNDPLKSLRECYRILKPKGRVIIGIVDSSTPLGKNYLQKKENSLFYKHARFFSSNEIIDLLKKTGFVFKESYQVLFGDYTKINYIQEPKDGYGEGGFCVLVGEK